MVKIINGKLFYSEEEKDKALSYFVTSTKDKVYAIKNLPPEIFGAFGSFFSRNPKDFREHLWDAIVGNIKGYNLNVQQAKENLENLLTGKYKEPSQALIKGLEKARNFFETWYGKYGHKSIANTVWLPFVANGVSQIIAALLAYDQLTFFIEQSTRYVEWEKDKIYFPKELMKSSAGGIYNKAINTLFDTYYFILNKVENYYKELYPFDLWLKEQSEKVKSNEKLAKRKYKREIKGKALDCARSLLPQAALTNLAFIIDARSLEKRIGMWKRYPLSEVREFAELLEKHGRELAPSLIKYTKPNQHYSIKFYSDTFSLENIKASKLERKVKIIDYPEDSLNKFVTFILRPHNQAPFNVLYEKVKKLPFKEKMRIILNYVKDRSLHDEFIAPYQEADMLKVNVEFILDLGAIRDLRRHQKNDRVELMPPTLELGYYIPEEIEKIGGNVKEKFEEAIQIALDAERKIKETHTCYQWYTLPMATLQILNMSIGIDQLQYMIYLRSTPEGNPSYREAMFELVKELAKKMPWLLGYKKPVDGKSGKEVYENSPFFRELREKMKNIPLVLRTEEASLHT